MSAERAAKRGGSGKRGRSGKRRTIKVDYLARVEGEGALLVKLKDDEVTDVKLKLFEPPRFFEAFLRGRAFTEAPDITARICGICPIAYQMGSVHAMESICGVSVDGPLRELRRLIYCGEWIESHALHIYMLHAPDFLGYEDAIQVAGDHPEIVKRGLRLKKTGNELMTLLGGREIHPVNVRVGGFYKVPEKRDFDALVDELEWARDAALETVRWVATFDFPDFERDYEYVALSHPDEYPLNEGRLVSNRGLDIGIQEYDENFEEEHVEHSTALHSTRRQGGSYVVGPLARYNLCFDRLPAVAREVAEEVGLGRSCNNPFKSIIVRAVETVFACDEALRIIRDYQRPERPAVEVEPRAGAGSGCSEAPRGICYHRYRIDGNGAILEAKICPPTSQNQKSIEEDLRSFVPPHVHLPHDELTWKCEQLTRNYDPCISCSTHFLDLRIDRS
jgi:coenzyme F420-reducing hydrogenase alpha subunit